MNIETTPSPNTETEQIHHENREVLSLHAKPLQEHVKVVIPLPRPDLINARLTNYLQMLANYRVQYESAYQKQILAQQMYLHGQNLPLNPNLNLLLSLMLLARPV